MSLHVLLSSPLHLFIFSAILFLLLRLLRQHVFKRSSSKTSIIIPSPESTVLPYLSKAQISQLPYPPDLMPNGKWVETTYGRIRTYTLGPSTGRKVVFVHGISTPCVSGRDIAASLAEKGCCVLLFDLPGRGYSECPQDVKQDLEMFSSLLVQVVTEVFGKFPVSLIGYSLGGCLAAAFAGRNPQMVESVVLLSSPGLMKKSVLSFPTRIALSPWIPDRIWEMLVSRQLKEAEKPPTPSLEDSAAKAINRRGSDGESGLRIVVKEDEWKPLDVDGIMRWQGIVHRGYLHSFVSSFRYAPIFDADADWKRLGEYLRNGSMGSGYPEYNTKANSQKLLAIYGADDTLTPPSLLERIKETVGEDCVEGVVVPGVGHELPVYRPGDIVNAISEFWGL